MEERILERTKENIKKIYPSMDKQILERIAHSFFLLSLASIKPNEFIINIWFPLEPFRV